MEISDISEQALKSRGVTQLGKLSRMLQSTLRKWPQAHLLNTQDAFGVSLDENTCMQVSYNGRWNAADMRDLLVLFATWLVADPAPIMRRGIPLAGVLRTVRQELEPSNMQED